MSEQKKVIRYTEQNKIKPMIEDVIPDFLDGDNKKIALEFIAYLRENKKMCRSKENNTRKRIRKPLPWTTLWWRYGLVRES